MWLSLEVCTIYLFIDLSEKLNFKCLSILLFCRCSLGYSFTMSGKQQPLGELCCFTGATAVQHTSIHRLQPKSVAFQSDSLAIVNICVSCAILGHCLILPSRSLSKVSADSQSVAGPVPLTVRAATRKLYSVPRSRPENQITKEIS